MVRSSIAAALLLILHATQALATERFISAIPANFYYAWRSPDPRIDMREYVPEGETYEKWSEMVTRQVMPGLAMPPPELFGAVAALQKRDCRNVGGKIIGEGKERGFPVLYGYLTCDSSRQFGVAENTMYKIIGAREGAYVLQHGWRAPHVLPENAERLAPLLSRAFNELRMAFVCSEGKLDDTECPPGVWTRMAAQDHTCAAYGMLTVLPTANGPPEDPTGGQKSYYVAMALGAPDGAEREALDFVGKMAPDMVPHSAVTVFVGLNRAHSSGPKDDLLRTGATLGALERHLPTLGVEGGRIASGLVTECMSEPRG